MSLFNFSSASDLAKRFIFVDFKQLTTASKGEVVLHSTIIWANYLLGRGPIEVMIYLLEETLLKGRILERLNLGYCEVWYYQIWSKVCNTWNKHHLDKTEVILTSDIWHLPKDVHSVFLSKSSTPRQFLFMLYYIIIWSVELVFNWIYNACKRELLIWIGRRILTLLAGHTT